MSLQDVISHVDLATYPQVALVLFLAAFAGVVLRVVRQRHEVELWERAARLPLDEAPGARGESA